jgi:hypothetical protein
MNRTTSYTRSNRKSYKPVLVPKIKYHKTIKITKKTNPYGKIMIEEETHKNGSVFIKTHYVEKDTINEFRKLTNYSKYLTITEEANTLKTLDLGINPNFKHPEYYREAPRFIDSYKNSFAQKNPVRKL